METAAHILMLFDNVNQDYVSRLQRGAERHAAAAGVALKSVNTYGSDQGPLDLIAAEGIAGVILTAPLCDDRHLMLRLEDLGIPFARIASMLDPGRGITVVMDEYEASRAITGVLLEAGHRRIAIVRGPRSHLASMRRYNGFNAAMGTKGGRVDPKLIVEGDFSKESGKALARQVFSQKPTAIFSSNDGMAAGLIESAREMGINIPGDVSIVGFDDDPIAQKLNPPLTTVRQPLGEMGAEACRLLVDHIKGKGDARAHADVPFEIVERQSVAAVSLAETA